MPDTDTGAARTVLEQRIRERQQTFEEFAEYAEKFARDHRETGTLSARHLQRLAAGRRPDGTPIGRPRPATARLLERIFGMTIGDLLAPPGACDNVEDSAEELRQLLHASRRVDPAVIELLHTQLDAIRRLDRQLGAVVAYEEVKTKIAQVKRLLSYSVSPDVRARLAAVLSELCTLAGWQALDLRYATESWQHYEHGKVAAAESGLKPYEAHTAAEQAFVLLDIGQPADAAALIAHARASATKHSPQLLRCWLAAAHGEALAANRQRSQSLREFDTAGAMLPTDSTNPDGPYVALDPTHLARWRGHALARFGDAEAVDVLTNALDRLDSSFTRAETALRVDLASALAAIGERETALAHATIANQLAAEIGSARQHRRIRTLQAQALRFAAPTRNRHGG
jgi:hypothetical protein